MNRWIRCTVGMVLVAVLSGIAVSCGSSPSAPDGSAMLRIMLTDAVTDDVEAVNVYFTSVTAKPMDGPPLDLVLELAPNPVNLLTLADTVTRFAAAAVEPGAYEYVHINIDEDRSSLVENGVEKRLRIPSEEIKIAGGFVVDGDTLTTVTIDFDADASLVALGNGEWLLKPVVVVTSAGSEPMP